MQAWWHKIEKLNSECRRVVFKNDVKNGWRTQMKGYNNDFFMSFGKFGSCDTVDVDQQFYFRITHTSSVHVRRIFASAENGDAHRKKMIDFSLRTRHYAWLRPLSHARQDK
jgi:hypothetical protein